MVWLRRKNIGECEKCSICFYIQKHLEPFRFHTSSYIILFGQWILCKCSWQTGYWNTCVKIQSTECIFWLAERWRQNIIKLPYGSQWTFFFSVRLFVGSAWLFGFFIPATTPNDLRLRRIFYPRVYPSHLFSCLNSWERASIRFLMFSAKQRNYLVPFL